MKFEINTGTTHPLAIGLGLSLSSLKRATGSVPLVDFESDLWYGTIEVGEPPVTFTGESCGGNSFLNDFLES